MPNPVKSRVFFLSRVFGGLLVFLCISAAYLYTFPQSNVFYAAIVLLHAIAGAITTVLLAVFLFRLLRDGSIASRIGWVLLSSGGIVGVILIKTGTPRVEWNLLYLHILLSLAGAGILFAEWAGKRGWLTPSIGSSIIRCAICLLVLAGLGVAAKYLRESRWQKQARIENPSMPPATMNGEGDGPDGPFFPSSAQVYGGQKIPSKFFMESDSCKRCHEDIYNQWFGSAHHFSSFNNQWYRKSIEYMQDVAGVKSSKWCAGCHDPSLLFSGMFDTPIRQIEDTPAAKAGLSCLMCHSIVQVKSTMGQGDFTLEYPKLHELAASDNWFVRTMHDFVVKLNPEPHRRTFLKPFMRTQVSEFCSSCHKVHLDVPVNRYRWIRGFNEYDNWQSSGVSGQGARSFYYPANPMMCADCHMPQIPSKDAGNVNGLVHSHRFPGANTAVPTANQDPQQLEASKRFLQDKQLTVDIFAVSPAGGETAAPSPAAATGPQLATTFAVGEESESNQPSASTSEARPVTAPLGTVDAAVRRGDDTLVDVVVRTRKVGHFFPGGTIDAFDVWLELKAEDEKGQTIFWSGKVEDDGKGPVEKGAHFYRSMQIDGHGNFISKRNAWATRSVVYVHLIPPGAADTAHFRMHIPETSGDKIILHAKLNYRKFMWWNTQFAYAGVEDPTKPHGEVTPDYDERKWAFTGDTSQVVGDLKKIPDLPIITVAEDTKSLRVLPRNAEAPKPQVKLVKEEWTRWNDYGIGLFLQGDLKGAAAAFAKITEIDPQNPDGWVNIGRCLVQEGDTEGAKKVLDKALAISPRLARANFFYARVLRQEGNYDEAVQHLQIVLDQYPRDRVAIDELGRIQFLQKKYAEAVKTFQRTLAVDPEDLQANYNLMLCYNGLGNEKRANEHKERYLRFKADESAQAITGAYRQAHPEDNNERQSVHEHVSVPLENDKSKKVAAAHKTAAPGATTAAGAKTKVDAEVKPAGGSR